MSASELLQELRRRGVVVEVANGRLRVNAPRGAVTAEDSARLTALKPELVALLTEAATEPPQLAPVSRDEPLALSFAQERLWFLDRLGTGGVPYNIPTALRIRGELDADALELALDDLVARQEAFRATVREVRGRPQLVVNPPDTFALPVEELPAPADDTLVDTLAREARRPFDLSRAPLLRARLFRLAEDEHVLLLVTHHFAADGWSMRVLVGDLAALYAARAYPGVPTLPPLRVQYADYAAWQRRTLTGDRLARELAYWRERLLPPPAPLELPFARHRPDRLTGSGGTLRPELDRKLTGELTEFSRVRGVTLFMTLAAGWAAVLARYTGTTDLAVATAVSHRPHRDLEPLVGCFINNLVLRIDLSGDPTFAQALARVREAAVGAFAHQDLPFEKLVEDLHPRRELGRTPLFQAMLVLENAPLGEVPLGDVSLEPVPVDTGTARFDFTLSLAETSGSLTGTLEYNADRYDAVDVERLWGHYRTLLAAAVAAPETPLSRLSLLDDAERREVVETVNDTAQAYPPPYTLTDWLEAQAAQTPTGIAVADEETELSYRELHRRADRLAARLRREGVGPETVVGVALERSVELSVALLAVLKAGGAYLPLDPDYPRERLAFMLADAAARCVLVSTRGDAAETLPPGTTVVAVDARDTTDAGAETGTGAGPDPDNAAYVIYTSGSTGQPKGVVVSHRAIVNRLRWMQQAFELAPGDHVAQKTPLSFDVSVWELFWPLLTGATLHMAPPGLHRDPSGLSRWMEASRITVAHFVPSMLHVFLEHGDLGGLNALRVVVASGEALTPDLVARFHRRLKAGLHNLYGPTEAAVDVSHWPCDPSSAESAVPIGRPIANLRLYVLDDELQPVPVGMPGELFIGGAGLARGYRQRPGLTAGRFVPDPFGPEPGGRLYRTGDLACRRADGALEFLGRRDFQVKIRGFRVELGEIESALDEHPAVGRSVAVTYMPSPGDHRLAVYVVTNPGSPVPASALREHLAARLPEHMVPGPVVFLESLPLSPSGKVDRAALPAPADAAAAADEEEHVPLSTPEERALGAIWCELLGVEEVGGQHDFFELGGHSLLAVQLTARIHEDLGVELPLTTVFTARRLAALAREVAAHQGGAAYRPLTALVDRDRLPLSAMQQRLWFLERFDPGGAGLNIPVALRLRGALEPETLAQALQYLVDRHEGLRATFHERDGKPEQRVRASVDVRPVLQDLRDLTPTECARRVKEETAAEADAPFDLERGPLLRARLLRVEDAAWILLLTAHHIAADGWSLGLLVQELAQAYGAMARGHSPDLSPLEVQYADFAAWQEQELADEAALAPKLEFWKNTLRGAPPHLELPADHPRPFRQTFRGARATHRLTGDAAAGLRAAATEAGATAFMAVTAVFADLLRRWSGQEELVVGAPVAGRPHRELDRVVGPFLNTVALRLDRPAGGTFREHLVAVRETVLEALQHADVPFERVLEAIRPRRDPSRTPVFQVFVNMLNFPAPRFEDLGLEVEEQSAPAPPAKFDLTLYLSEEGEDLSLDLVYNADLFSGERMEEFLDQLRQLLDAAARNPHATLASHSLITGRSRERLPDPAASLDDTWPGPVHELVARHADRDPAAVAVEDAEGAWSYGDVQAAVVRVARDLGELGVQPGDPVAVYAHRSAPLAAAVLGVLRAGAVLVVLDPAYPGSRLLRYLEAARPAALVALAQAGPLPPELADVCPVLELPANRFGLAPDEPAPPPASVGPDDPACLTFTSGSTGQPKAIVGGHRSLTHFLAWQVAEFGLTPRDRYSLLSGLAHDPLQRDIFTPLCTGATLCIPESDRLAERGWLATWASRERITIAHLTPAVANLLADDPPEGGLPDLRWAFLLGEAVTATTVNRLRRAAPNIDCVNLYGSTETQRAVAYYVSPKDPTADPSGRNSLPLGRGMPDVQLLLQTPGGGQAGVGELGEILVRSPHLALGYRGRPELTAERFTHNPFTGEDGDRVYRTGDLGRYRPDGMVEWAGRADRQIQVRGFRVEPAEIEAQLVAHPSVTAVVVQACPVPSGDAQLVAYVVPAEGTSPSAGELRSHLADRLPASMVPVRYVTIEKVPLTPNGKVDFAALPAISTLEDDAEATRAPHDAVELRLLRIWEDVLGRREMGVRDDFFAVGGHSLLAVQLMSRIEKEFGARLPLTALFQQPTVEALASGLRRASGSVAHSPLVPVQAQGDRPPLLCVHPVGGTVLCYQGLARHLGPRQPFYGLEAQGVGGEHPPLVSVEAMADHYLAAVREAELGGPYFLSGWSFGGLVAYEMACRLRASGEEVALLALLDTWPPGSLGALEDEAEDDATVLRLMARALGDLAGGAMAPAVEELQALPDRDARLALVVERARAAAVLPPEVGVDQIRPLVAVVEANLEARRTYRPPSYPGQVLLLRAAQPPAPPPPDDPTLGWGRTAAHVDVDVVPGDHYTMLADPNTQEIALRLTKHLTEAPAPESR